MAPKSLIVVMLTEKATRGKGKRGGGLTAG